MPTQKKTSRTFSYKRVDGYRNANFETLLRLAIKTQVLIGRRKRDVSSALDGETFHLLLDYVDNFNSLAGVICSYSPGRHQQVFTVEDDAEKISLTSIKPPTTSKGEKNLQQEFLDGCFYFYSRGNHLIVSQSLGFRSSHAESYFNWLLWKRAKLHQNQGPMPVLCLNDQLPPNKFAQIQNVKSLTISNPIQFVNVLNKEQTMSKTFNIKPKGLFWETIKKFAPSLPDQYSLARALSSKVVQASLILKLGREGKDATDFIDAVATVMRNSDTDDIETIIDMGKYGKLKGNDFKLSRQQVFDLTDGKLNQLSLFRKMSDWLDELIAVKRIFKDV